MSDLIFFNSSDGFSEAFLRGLRKSILSESNYGILSSTHNLRDLKTVNLSIFKDNFSPNFIQFINKNFNSFDSHRFIFSTIKPINLHV